MRMDRFGLPTHGHYLLRNARVPVSACRGLALRDAEPATGLATADIAVADGRIVAEVPGPADHVADLRGRLVLPCFVDMHVHLDKAHTVSRTGMSSGGLPDAVRRSVADAANRDDADLAYRMRFSLRCAHAHGTGAIRTHLDTPETPAESPAWRVFEDLKQEWRGRIDLQAAALMSIERAEADDFFERARQVAAFGGVLGAFIAPAAASAARLERFLAAAGENGLDVDFHVDETLDPDARGVEAIADAVLRTGFAGRVTVGHCCSLATMDENAALAILDKVAAAGIHVVSLPLTNLFLMDRSSGRTPRRRGLTLVQEMRHRAISVSFASDNVRDAFFPHGDFDMLEVLRMAVRAAHLEAAPQDWLASVTTAPAAAMGIAAPVLAPGRAADFVLYLARDWTELFSRPQADRIVVRDGAPLAPGLPDADEHEPARLPA